MLKALELCGFKSFADRTRFDFPPGITVIVGPNGSGKSNIVDGLKWVLGEQSAKSLRGKDMADVIFKGSGGAQGRKPANSAEATIILDNADRRFPYDHDEIRVSRRVYRSGESEYLINNEAVRLRDIRDLFRGTGVGTDAYSLIEQGKVDRMLQSTSKDRRAIFEEAAGISRFKAKSIETQRRLARVEQNLIRLADIVEEVGSRYRGIKAQASKAVRYRQATSRLKLLRTHVAKIDYQFYQSRLEQLETETEQLSQQLEARRQDVTTGQEELRRISAEYQQAVEDLESWQRQSADLREQLAGLASEAHEKQRRDQELEQRLEKLAAQLDGGQQRRRQLADEQNLLLSEIEQCEANHHDLRTQLEALQSSLQQRLEQRERQQQQAGQLQGQQERLRGLANQLATSLAAAGSEVAALDEGLDKKATTLSDYRQRLSDLRTQQVELDKRAAGLHQQAESKDSDLAHLAQAIASGQETLEQLRASEVELKSQQVGDQQRSNVIREMESQLEGVNSGVKQVLAQARQGGNEDFREVVGLVADLIQVEMQHALLIDLALGEVAQHVVTRGDRLIRAVAQERLKLAGRVGLLPLDRPISLGGDRRAKLPADSQVVGPAVELVQAKTGFQEFVDNLLGGTWIVASLSAAIDFRQQGFHDLRYVTMAGEIVEPDGRVIVGAKSPANNLVSRRSELRLLETQLAQRQQQLAELATQIQAAREQWESDRQAHQQLLEEQKELSAQLQQVERVRETNLAGQQHWTDLAGQLESEQQTDQTRLAQLRQELEQQQQQQTQCQSDLQQTENDWQAAQAAAQQALQEAQEIERRLTTSKVQFAKLEQQLEQFAAQQEAIITALRERDEQLAEMQAELTQSRSEWEDVRRRLSELDAAQNQLQEQKNQLAGELTAASQRRDTLQSQRQQLNLHLETEQSGLQRLEHRQLEIEGEVNQLGIQRAQLLERLRDDYGLEIEEVLHYQPHYAGPPVEEAVEDPAEDEAADQPDPGSTTAPTPERQVDQSADAVSAIVDDLGQVNDLVTNQANDRANDRADVRADDQSIVPLDREEVDREIQQLRRKINSIGAVNMDALAELEQLEERYQHLHQQYQDLQSAKDGLQRIIQRINADSRRIFAETLEAIRINFQQLYRKTFGGGHADLVLDDSEDILEAGIEILATPPGKSEFSNSLLSGGEKALTAVSLLLAIFKYRPSPFCVLDEVDAPFDEANIGRFIDVLKEFLGWTRFVIVTHSKKTMTAATTLYGVTMQDSGISKRVSIKFEEVSEDGELLLDGDPAAQVGR